MFSDIKSNLLDHGGQLEIFVNKTKKISSSFSKSLSLTLKLITGTFLHHIYLEAMNLNIEELPRKLRFLSKSVIGVGQQLNHRNISDMFDVMAKEINMTSSKFDTFSSSLYFASDCWEFLKYLTTDEPKIESSSFDALTRLSEEIHKNYIWFSFINELHSLSSNLTFRIENEELFYNCDFEMSQITFERLLKKIEVKVAKSGITAKFIPTNRQLEVLSKALASMKNTVDIVCDEQSGSITVSGEIWI